MEVKMYPHSVWNETSFTKKKYVLIPIIVTQPNETEKNDKEPSH